MTADFEIFLFEILPFEIFPLQDFIFEIFPFDVFPFDIFPFESSRFTIVPFSISRFQKFLWWDILTLHVAIPKTLKKELRWIISFPSRDHWWCPGTYPQSTSQFATSGLLWWGVLTLESSNFRYPKLRYGVFDISRFPISRLWDPYDEESRLLTLPTPSI